MGEFGDTSTIKIPKKWFGVVPRIVTALMIASGVGAKACDYHRNHILKEEAIENRLRTIETWKCKMGWDPGGVAGPHTRNPERTCKTSREGD